MNRGLLEAIGYGGPWGLSLEDPGFSVRCRTTGFLVHKKRKLEKEKEEQVTSSRAVVAF